MIRVTGRISVSVEGATLADAVAAYRQAYKDASPDEWEEVNGDDVAHIIAWCGCGKPILDDDPYFDGNYELCGECRHGAKGGESK